MGFAFGLGAALTWALDTIILSIALGMPAFTTNVAAVALAPFVSTFLHDVCSAICAFLYMGLKHKLGKTWKALRSRAGLVIIVAAIIGVPVGMTGYVTAINNIGSGYAAAISAFFPAFGTFFGDLRASRAPEVISVAWPLRGNGGHRGPWICTCRRHPRRLDNRRYGCARDRRVMGLRGGHHRLGSAEDIGGR